MVRDGYKQTEVGVIPVDWEVVDLREACTYIKGYPFRSSSYSKAGRRVIRISDTDSNGINENEFVFVSEADAKSLKQFELSEDDVIVQTVGSKPPMYDSMVGKTTLVKSKNKGDLLNQNAVRLRLESGENRLLFGNLKSKRYYNYIESIIVGNANQGSIKLSDLFQFPIPLPPTLTEQRAIATALSDTDALLSALDALIGKKEAFKRGMMEGLLSGERRLDGFAGEWVETTIDEIATVDEKNLGADTQPDYEFKYLSLENVNKGVVKGFTKMFFSESPSRARRIIEEGCIVFATVRPLLMSHALIEAEDKDLIASTGFAVVRANDNTDSRYLFYAMTSSMIIDQVGLLLVGSNYPAINSKDVKKLELSLPPLPEQRAIARVLSDLDAELAGLRARRAKLGLVKGGMMEVLLGGEVRLV